MDIQAIFSEVNTWAAEDRVRLMEHLWDQLADQGYQPTLTDELRAELDRRCAELDRDPDSAIPWETVRDRALQRFTK